jgi:acetate kinase
VDAQVETALESLATLAPLHNPVALRWLRAARQVIGNVPHVAAFDTAFFNAMPAFAHEYPLPRKLVERYGLRRYGFHGLAHASMLRRWQAHNHSPTADNSRLICLQLGSGCSASAIRNGRAIDTSMGFSPVSGLMMATRSGDIDPGLLTYLQQQALLTPAQLEHLLNYESGLLGVADEADMQSLLTRRDERAELAIDMYCQRVRNYIGAYFVALGGVDAILFGGGVGEHAPEIRRRILIDMQWAGVRLDDDANRAAVRGVARISKIESPVAVWVMPPDEQRELANAAIQLLHLAESHA